MASPYICSRLNGVWCLHRPAGKLGHCLKDISWGSCKNKTTAHQRPALPRAFVHPDPVTSCHKNTTRAGPSEVKLKKTRSSQPPQTTLLPCQTPSLIVILLVAKQKQEISSIVVFCLQAQVVNSSRVTEHQLQQNITPAPHSTPWSL